MYNHHFYDNINQNISKASSTGALQIHSRCRRLQFKLNSNWIKSDTVTLHFSGLSFCGRTAGPNCHYMSWGNVGSGWYCTVFGVLFMPWFLFNLFPIIGDDLIIIIIMGSYKSPLLQQEDDFHWRRHFDMEKTPYMEEKIWSQPTTKCCLFLIQCSMHELIFWLAK